MNWDGFLDRMSKVVDLFIKLEVHAFALIGIGGVMWAHGNHELGSGVATAGLAVFRGNRQ